MKKIKSLFLSLLLIVPAIGTKAQELQTIPQLPIDTAVRKGVLPNGMTYYIRHNNLPAHQAFFYIVQKVGSVQEEESQRGLAHFLEHMAFNGTKNFPDSSLVNYCERIGVKFGRDLNAYTSTDETVYNIDNVPVSPSNIDSCLLILKDWSHSLSLQTSEIDKERGVIHEEWRLRSSAMQRILERNLEKLYPNSRYGRRMPIGLMSIVDSFAPDTLRAYYKKWYRPDLQGIIVVGDINVAQVEKQVKAMFSNIPNPQNEAKYEHYPVPDNDKPIYVIDKDKEQQQNVVMLFFKQDPAPEKIRNTQIYAAQQYIAELLTASLNARLAEFAQQKDCPYLMASVDYGHYLISKTKDAFEVSIVPKEGQSLQAIQRVMAEIQRARQHGLTYSEITRTDDEELSSLEKRYNNRDKQQSSYFIPSYVRNFLEGTPVLSISDRYHFIKDLSQQLRARKMLVPAVNSMLKSYTASIDTNFVAIDVYPEKQGLTLPTTEQLAQAIQAGYNEKLPAYVDKVKNEPLISKLPKAGKVVSTSPASFGYTKWVLSNGTVVYTKKTNFNESEVMISGRSWGGYDLYNYKNPKILVNANLSSMMNNVGLGNFSSTEFDKAMAGKQATLVTSIGMNSESFDGTATPKDLRTLFEILYLTFTKPGNDANSFNTMVDMMKSQMKNISKVPETAFSDSVSATFYNHDIRVKRLTEKELQLADFNTVRKMFTERFKNMNDFTLYVTGNFNEDSLRNYLEQYVASLPKGKVETKKDPALNFASGVITNRFKRKMETPKGRIEVLLHGKTPYSLQENLVVEAFGQILTQRLLKSIREDAGIAYSVGASGNTSYQFKDSYYVLINCPVKPAQADKALQLINLGIEEIAKQGVTQDELDKVKQVERKDYLENQKFNAYWNSLIIQKTLWNKDLHTGYEGDINKVTTKDVQEFAKNVLLKQKNILTVVMLPESLKE